MRVFWLCLLPAVATVAAVASSAYLSHAVVLPWGLGEIGYLGAVTLFGAPMVTTLFASLVAALWPRGISLGVLIYLPAPALWLVLAIGMGTELSWPSSWEQITMLLLPLLVVLPLLMLPGLLYLVLRAEFRERAGIVPEQPVLNG